MLKWNKCSKCNKFWKNSEAVLYSLLFFHTDDGSSSKKSVRGPNWERRTFVLYETKSDKSHFIRFCTFGYVWLHQDLSISKNSPFFAWFRMKRSDRVNNHKWFFIFSIIDFGKFESGTQNIQLLLEINRIRTSVVGLEHFQTINCLWHKSCVRKARSRHHQGTCSWTPRISF